MIFSTELYEGLKLAQRGRLDDQRGTEINFEMPDFIKRNQFSQVSWLEVLAVRSFVN